MRKWRTARREARQEFLADMWTWERHLMLFAGSHEEYEDLRHWPIHRAMRWLVQQAIKPN